MNDQTRRKIRGSLWLMMLCAAFMMVLAFESVSRANWPIGWLSRGGEEDRLRMIAVHEAVAEAIAQRDADAAEAAMAEHFDDTVRALAIAGVS